MQWHQQKFIKMEESEIALGKVNCEKVLSIFYYCGFIGLQCTVCPMIMGLFNRVVAIFKMISDHAHLLVIVVG